MDKLSAEWTNVIITEKIFEKAHSIFNGLETVKLAFF